MKRKIVDDSGGNAKRSKRSRVLVVNWNRIDFDGTMDVGPLEEVSDVAFFPSSTGEEMVARAAELQPVVMVTKEIPVPRAVISALPSSVQMICEAGTGFNNIDLATAKERGITVTNVAGYSSVAVAHLVITHILNFSCSLTAQYAALRARDTASFTGCTPCGPGRGMPHFEVSGKVLGLVGGTGGIAGEVRAVAAALGMPVLVHSRSGHAPEGCEAVSMPDLLARSDFVSLHCPLAEDTRHLIDRAALASMKDTAFLINTARGAVVDEAALVEALQASPPLIAGAALDVQEVEPPAPDSALYTLPSVVLTPHYGWKRQETRQRLVRMVADNVRAFLEGAPINVVGNV